METLKPLLEEHPFFTGLPSEYLDLITGCAANAVFNAGEPIFREGGEANHFFLIRYGKAAVEIFVPGKGPVTIQTVQQGDILGWSWLVPPFRWHHDARALELVRALSFDGECLRRKCESDPRLGYELMQRFAQVIVQRLQNTQVQLLDVYGNAKQAKGA